jgi:large subunit ribosomal protein L21
MYAVFLDRGKQYKVKTGEEVLVDVVGKAPGEALAFESVLLLGETGGPAVVGTPTVQGARVEAKVLGVVKGRKTLSFVLRKRKNSRRIRGHRQQFTRVKILKIASPAAAKA